MADRTVASWRMGCGAAVEQITTSARSSSSSSASNERDRASHRLASAAARSAVRLITVMLPTVRFRRASTANSAISPAPITKTRELSSCRT